MTRTEINQSSTKWCFFVLPMVIDHPHWNSHLQHWQRVISLILQFSLTRLSWTTIKSMLAQIRRINPDTPFAVATLFPLFPLSFHTIPTSSSLFPFFPPNYSDNWHQQHTLYRNMLDHKSQISAFRCQRVLFQIIGQRLGGFVPLFQIFESWNWPKANLVMPPIFKEPFPFNH